VGVGVVVGVAVGVDVDVGVGVRVSFRSARDISDIESFTASARVKVGELNHSSKPARITNSNRTAGKYKGWGRINASEGIGYATRDCLRWVFSFLIAQLERRRRIAQCIPWRARWLCGLISSARFKYPILA
jgi:hypothetical protein